MNQFILIITNGGDLHADIMESRLASRGARYFRINLDRFPADYRVSLQTGKSENSAWITHTPSDKSVNLFEAKSVWTRKTAKFTFGNAEDMSSQEAMFVQDETEHLLYSIIFSLQCYWVSHPTAMRSSSWKGEQALRAAAMGFSTPTSLITNVPDIARTFCADRSHNVVVKTMSSAMLAADRVDSEELVVNGMSTTVVTDEMIHEIDAVELCPAYFQGQIDKAYEVRATVIGNRLFAAKICSQDNERTRIDYRDFSADIDYQFIELPPEIRHRCLEFVHSYGLQYGAIDLIVTPDNDYVFLENNPCGQFWFVEQLVPELTMMDHLATCLIEGGDKE